MPDIFTQYLETGCMRCVLGNTPQCKVHRWENELLALREIILQTGLNEERKWSVPCYSYKGKNILILAAFKGYVAVSFFKGCLLTDSHNLLSKPGEETQAVRILRFVSLKEVKEREKFLREYIYEAIENEMSGVLVKFPSSASPEMPEELLAKFAEDPLFQSAFESLTPGRRRGYLLHFGGAKQASTRISRIEKCKPRILEGKGLQD